MKVSDLKALIESSVRKVVREELDYKFEKLNEQVHRQDSGLSQSSVDIKKIRNEALNKTRTQESREFFRSKFGDMFNDVEPFDETSEASTSQASILDESNLRSLATSKGQKGVLKALTRDYTDMVRAMDKI